MRTQCARNGRLHIDGLKYHFSTVRVPKTVCRTQWLVKSVHNTWANKATRDLTADTLLTPIPPLYLTVPRPGTPLSVSASASASASCVFNSSISIEDQGIAISPDLRAESPKDCDFRTSDEIEVFPPFRAPLRKCCGPQWVEAGVRSCGHRCGQTGVSDEGQ